MDKNVVEIGDPPAKFKSAVWKFFGFPKYKEGGITVVKRHIEDKNRKTAML